MSDRDPPTQIASIAATGLGGVHVLYVLYADGQLWQMQQYNDGNTKWLRINDPRARKD